MPHWNFNTEEISKTEINVNYLSHNTFLIVDNDNTADSPNSKKHKRKVELKEILKENFYEHKSREIENIIKLDILEKMLQKDNDIDKIVRKKYTSSRYPYIQSVLSNPNMGIGSFIDDTYAVKKKYKSYTGDTIRSKAEFANKICNEIYSLDDLTEEAKDLTKKVADFIIKNN